MGIRTCLFVCLFVSLFSCSTERIKRGESSTYGPSPWRMASVGLMNNLCKIMLMLGVLP